MSEEYINHRSPSLIESELYFLIARFLDTGPCSEAAKVLKEEITKHELLPNRLDWLGNGHPTDFHTFSHSNSHIPDQFLHLVCKRIGGILDKETPPSVRGIQSLLGVGKQSLLRSKGDSVKLLKKKASKNLLGIGCYHPSSIFQTSENYPSNISSVIRAKEISGNACKSHLLPCKFYSSYHLLRRNLGHLSSVYCILFDTAGFFIFTGADDNLVKIWTKRDGRLLATLRGHNAEITDMDVNLESTLLASGSCDKIIRLWCLQTTAPLAVLTGHTGMITSLKFSPSRINDERFLVSTGNDGCVLFYQYNYKTLTFNPRPIKYVERARSGAQMICSSFSPGGVFLACGSADHHVRIYLVNSGSGPEKIFEIEAHLDRVDSLQFSNTSHRFVSGSKDGTAKIWRYEKQHWRSLTLQMSSKLDGLHEETSHKLQVTMVGWSKDDQFVITAVNNHLLKAWNSYTGSLIYVLKGHQDEVFVIESHPKDDRVILSAGHDGKVIIWDLTTGDRIKVFDNLIEGHGHGAVFDCRFSPDGNVFASTDSHGFLSIFGMGSNEAFQAIPEQQFFHTDYRPLIRDANHHVLDEQTQQAPHLMPPPFLVDIDGNPYPPELQRLVPGRERCNNDQLIPYIAVSAGGEAEVLQPIRQHDSNDGINQDMNHDALAPNIDEMIEIFEAQHPGSPAQHRDENENNENPELSPERSGVRRDGDVEGVRQSHGNWQSRDRQGEMLAWTKRNVVKKMSRKLLVHLISNIIARGEGELLYYRAEKKKRPVIQQNADAIDQRYIRKARQQKGRKHNYNVRSRESDVNSSMEGSRRVQAVLDGDENSNIDVTQSSDEDSSALTSQRVDVKESNMSSSSSSESDATTDSDWEEEPKRKKPQNDKSVTRKQPKRGDSDLGDHNYTVLESSPGSPASLRREEVKPRIKSSCSRPKSKSRAATRKANIRSQLPTGLKELPEKFKPPEWLTNVIPKKAPYQPQVGDELMYFHQGHKCYFAAVKRTKVYDINIKHQPWTKLKLRDQELVKVIGIKYEIKPPHLCLLKLALMESATNVISNETFTIKYHDMPDVIDFLVLRQYYNTAMSRNWKPSDRFRSVIDDAWWIGTIESQEPFELESPDSMFQCFNVKWDNGETEKMSPWDMELIDDERLPQHQGGGVTALPYELENVIYQPDKNEWPPCGRDVECDRILRGLEFIMDLAIAEPFNAPVDLNAYPMYAMVVEYPIDLSTIRGRIENRYYRRLKSLLFDVKYIENDANLFNEPGTPIVKKARMVAELFKRFIEDSNCEDVMSLYQEISEAHHLKDNEMNNGDSNSDSDQSGDDKNHGGHYLRDRKSKIKSQRETRNSSLSLNSWKEDCQKLLNFLLEREDSTPFRYPVDQFEYPDYHEIIDHPMDLSTIKEELIADNYDDPNTLCKDVRLVFENSKNYNTNKKSRIYSMTIRLSATFEEHFKAILKKWESAKRRLKSRSKFSSQCHSSYNEDEPCSSKGQRRLRRSLRRMSDAMKSESEEVNGDVAESEVSSDGNESENSSSLTEDSSKEDSEGSSGSNKETKTGKLSSNGDARSTRSKPHMSSDSSSGEYEQMTKRVASRNKSTNSTALAESDHESNDNLPNENGNFESSDGSTSRDSSDPSNRLKSQDRKKMPNSRLSNRRIYQNGSNGSSNSSGESNIENSSSLDDDDSNSSQIDDSNIKDSKKSVPTTRRSSRNTIQKNNTNLRRTSKRRLNTDSDDSVAHVGRVPKKRMTTRNRGKRTVAYQEDSDFEYYGDKKSESNSDDDDDDDDRPITSISSRGRLRRLTPLARSMVFE